MISIATTEVEILNCFEVMQELRPKLIKESFVETVKHLQADGYQLAYIEENQEVVAVAGLRICTNLFMGKHLYIDDLSTADTHRSRGFGQALIHWIKELAIKEDCKVLHLDSGTHRAAAHKFYFNQGFSIASYHFSQEIE